MPRQADLPIHLELPQRAQPQTLWQAQYGFLTPSSGTSPWVSRQNVLLSQRMATDGGASPAPPRHKLACAGQSNRPKAYPGRKSSPPSVQRQGPYAAGATPQPPGHTYPVQAFN